MTVVESIVEHLILLAEQGPPSGWDAPKYDAIGWDELSYIEQSLMLRMQAIAIHYGGPGTRVYLHGARAKGQATEHSDYDIFVVFPDGTNQYNTAYAMSDMNHLAGLEGIHTSRDWVYESAWRAPDPVRTTIIQEVKSYGIEIPVSEV
jgi:hypothetical protein